MFNDGWYLKSYPDVSDNGADPIEHYLKFGAEERRNPSPEFDTQWYLNNYSDVAEDGINPLVHYIKFGQNEGRAMSAYHHPSLPAPGAVCTRRGELCTPFFILARDRPQHYLFGCRPGLRL